MSSSFKASHCCGSFLLKHIFALVMAIWLFQASADQGLWKIISPGGKSDVRLHKLQRSRKAAKKPQTEKKQCNLRELASDPPMSFEHFRHGSEYQGLYVNKDAKFAMCLIEKNACTRWSAIMHKLKSGDLNAGPIYGIVHNSWSPENATAVFADKNSTRAVFVRDPLERFLSTFLNKCFASACAGDFCFMRKSAQDGNAISFSKAVDWIKSNGEGSDDGHWKLQSRHCELKKRLHEYTILGVMESSTMARNAACLLERAGLSYLNVQTSKNNAPPLWQNSTDTQEDVTEYLKSFYTKEAAEIVYNAYREDYETFDLPRPNWIHDAHGMLYSQTQPTRCKTILAYPELNDDIDDIPELAHKAGFVL